MLVKGSPVVKSGTMAPGEGEKQTIRKSLYETLINLEGIHKHLNATQSVMIQSFIQFLDLFVVS